MKNLKKLVTIAASVVMATSLFTGCSYDAKNLADAFSKTNKVTSSESQTEIGLRFSGENLSAEEQEAMNKVIPVLNNAKITMNTKMNQNEDATAAKVQADMSMKFADMAFDMGVWVDANTTDGNPTFKEIIKMPAIAASQMNGKQYVVLDSSKMNNANGMNMDFSKLTQTSKDMQKELSSLVLNNMTNFDPDFNLVTNKGSLYMDLPGGKKPVRLYQVKLDDKTFKDLIKYTSNSLVNNADARNFLKDYMTAMVKASNANVEQATAAETEINKSFADFESGLPEFTTKMNKVLNTFDNVTLVGDKGIVINYAVDNDGYIVSQKGNIDLVFDAPKFIAAVQSLDGTSNSANKLTGVYKLGIDFDTTTYNINKNVVVKFPELTSENSIQYEDLIKQEAQVEAKVKEQAK